MLKFLNLFCFIILAFTGLAQAHTVKCPDGRAINCRDFAQVVDNRVYGVYGPNAALLELMFGYCSQSTNYTNICNIAVEVDFDFLDLAKGICKINNNFASALHGTYTMPCGKSRVAFSPQLQCRAIMNAR